jgi:hypothetical protein
MGDLSSGGIYDRKRSSGLLRHRHLTVSTSRNWLFLGRLVSTRACLRFTSRSHLHANRLKLQTVTLSKVGEFSTGEMRKFQPALTEDGLALDEYRLVRGPDNCDQTTNA